VAARGFNVVVFDLDATLADARPDDLAAALNHALVGLAKNGRSRRDVLMRATERLA
jgi:phosphoglycolate phosphatase-like HAD superfamily hydrolase